ncbi:MAG: hypothetical protein EHM58_18215 [Ignavibacteriae bacterium]|nr:MAG: hypothetical protein EHM58_18215 [Ignavibacteriota bacterium]
MKNLIFTIFIIFALFSAKIYADIQDFTVINKTGSAISSLYVSHASEDKWGSNLLGVKALADGESVLIKFSGYGDKCNFDIKITDKNGKAWVLYNVDLCTLHDITFTSEHVK